jgi:hypothetical protein
VEVQQEALEVEAASREGQLEEVVGQEDCRPRRKWHTIPRRTIGEAIAFTARPSYYSV